MNEDNGKLNVVVGVKDEASAGIGKIVNKFDDLKAKASSLGKTVDSLQSQFAKGGMGRQDIEKAVNATEQYIQMQKRLKDEILKMPQSKRSAEDIKKMREASQIIQEQEWALSKLKKTIEAMDAAQAKGSSSRNNAYTEYMKLRRELMSLEATGQGNTQVAEQLRDKISKMGTAIGVANKQISALTSGATQWGGLVSGLQGVTGAMAAASGAMSMFATSSEDLQKIQTKLQSSMSILMGLSAVSNTLYQTSAFRVTTVTTVTKIWDKMNLKAAKGLHALGVGAKAASVAAVALNATLMAIGGAVIVAAIAGISKLIEKQKQLRESQVKVNEAANTALAQYKMEQMQWKASEGDLERRSNLYRELRKSAEANGYAIRSMNDLEDYYVKNQQNVVNAIMARAKAQTYATLISEEYAKQFEWEEKADRRRERKWNKGMTAIGGLLSAAWNQRKTGKLWGYDAPDDGQFQRDYDEYVSKGLNHADKKAKKAEDRIKSFTESWKENMATVFESIGNNGAETYENLMSYMNDLRSLRNKLTTEELALLQKTETDKYKLEQASYENEKKLLMEEYNEKKKTYNYNGWNTEELDAVYERLLELKQITHDMRLGDIYWEKGLKEDERFINEEAAYTKFLAEYGSFQEKREAIAAQYDEQIISTTLDGERKILLKQKEMALKQLDGDMIEMYGNYQQKRAKLAEEWDKKIADADPMFAESAKRAKEVALASFDLSNDPALKKAMGDVNKMTQETINSSISLLRRKLADIKPESEEEIRLAKEINEQISALEDAAFQNPFESWGMSLDSVGQMMNNILFLRNKYNKAVEAGDEAEQDAMKEQLKAAKEQAKLAMVGFGVSSFVNGLSKAADLMRQMADASGDMGLAEQAEQLSAIAQNFQAAGQGAASGGWIGAIIGGVTDIINQTVEGIVSAKMEVIEMKNNAIDFQRALELAALAIDESQFSNIFGTSSFNKIAEASAKADEAMQKYLNVVNSTEKMKEALSLPPVYNLQRYMDALRGFTDLQAMQVKTLERNGWQNLWGKGDQYTSLKDLRPELWDENGEFNVEEAKIFLQTNTQLTDIQRKEIQNVIDLKEAYDDAFEAMKDTVGEFVNGTLSTLSDKMLENFLATGDAIMDATDLLGDFEKQMAKAAIQAMLMKTVFTEENQNKMVDLMAAGNYAEATEFYRKLIEQANSSAPEITELLKSLGLAEAQGSREATPKGIAQASQDSVDELNGRMTAVQGHTYQMNENLKVVTATCSEILVQVMGIHDNTTALASEMSAMRKDLSNLRSNVDDIARTGLKMYS